MLKLIVSRVLQGVVVLLVVSVLTFVMLAAAGGDALSALQSDARVTRETLERQRYFYGLDQPLAVRYGRWLAGVVRGDMGKSMSSGEPVAAVIRRNLPRTLSLAAAAFLLASVIALALGAIAARRPRGLFDKLCGALIILASSTPRIVLALVGLAFAVRTNAFQIGGESAGLASSLLGLLVPAFVLAVPLIATLLAQVRDGLAAALREEFVQVARAKGLSERVVTLRHALRAALNPLITISGYSLGGLVGGSVVVESVFGREGLGRLSVLALSSRDVPLLMGVVLVTSTAVLVGNLVADILLRLNDPRLRAADGG